MILQKQFTGFEQNFLFHHRPFVAKIYEGEKNPPEGFNIVKLVLDASDRSLLRWQTILDRARTMIQNGFSILWELDLAIIEGSLEDHARFLALRLNVEHFALNIWPEFAQNSLGVSLYSGKYGPDPDYLLSLAAALPEETPCFVFLDTTEIQTPAAYFNAVNPEQYGHFHLVLKGRFPEVYPYAVPALGWGHPFSPLGFSSKSTLSPLNQRVIPLAICHTSQISEDQWAGLLQNLEGTSFRVIPENLLTHEWEGVDDLIIFAGTLSLRGERKLRGFIAAGGHIITYPDDAALLPLQETSRLSSLLF